MAGKFDNSSHQQLGRPPAHEEGESAHRRIAVRKSKRQNPVSTTKCVPGNYCPAFINHKLSMYSLYMATLGNRPDLFPGYLPSTDAGTDYEIPPEALEDEQFAAMMAEAEKYIGFPYVWGGSSPATSFDCSGFVSWVVNNCGVGWSVGRLTAQGLYNICTPVSEAEAKPGDLVFFEYTYEGPWITHVGIYVGEGYILHAGNPIGYLKFMDSYYSDNFVGYGRLPAV